MNYFETTIEYILDADHWTGAMGLGTLTAQHVGYSLLGVGLSALRRRPRPGPGPCRCGPPTIPAALR